MLSSKPGTGLHFIPLQFSPQSLVSFYSLIHLDFFTLLLLLPPPPPPPPPIVIIIIIIIMAAQDQALQTKNVQQKY
jgi:hypothetical protein